MNTKCVKELKSQWSKVSREGGRFVVVLDGFPESEERGPILALHPHKELEPAAIKKLDRDADVTGKRMWGRVTVEPDGIAFHIALDAPTRSPQLLRQALKHLVDRPECHGLRLEPLRTAGCRMDEAIALDGQAAIDPEQTVGKKRSLLDKLTGSDYARLLARVAKWHESYGNTLSSATFGKASAALDDLRERAKAWAEGHAGEKDSTRGKQVERLRTQVRLARERLDAFRARVAADDEADRVVDGLLAEPPTDLGAPVAAAETLRKTLESLGRRRASTTDETERALLAERMDAIEGKLDEVGAALQQETSQPGVTPGQWKARGKARMGKHEVVVARLRETAWDGRAYELRVPKEVRDQAQQLGEGLLDDLRHAQDNDVKDLVQRFVELHGTLDQVGGDIRGLRDGLSSLAVELTGRGWQGEDLGSLGRGNDGASRVRAAFCRLVGTEFTDELFDGGVRELVATLPKLDPKELDEEREPGSTFARARLTTTVTDLEGRLDTARAGVVGPVGARLGFAVPAELVLRTMRDLEGVKLGGSAPLASPPTVEAIANRLVRHDPGSRDRYVDALTGRALAFLEAQAPDDPSPEETARLVREHLARKVVELGAVDLDDALKGFAPPHLGLPERTDEELARALVEGGALVPPSVDQLEAERTAEQQATDAYGAIEELRATVLAEAIQGMIDASPRTYGALTDAFTGLLDRMLADPSAVPKPIRELVGGLRDLARTSGLGDEGALLAASDLLVLRWISPAILALHVPTPDLQNSPTAVTLSALVQYVANGTLPKDTLLFPFCRPIEQYRERYLGFLRELLALAGTGRTVDFQSEQQERGGPAYDSSPVDEQAYQDDPDKHWGIVIQRRLKGFAMDMAKERGLIVRFRTWEALFAEVRDWHREQLPSADLRPVWRGRSELTSQCLERAQQLLHAESVRVQEEDDDDSVAFEPFLEDERYTARTHWDECVLPRLVGLFNEIAVRPPYHELRALGTLAELYRPLSARHAEGFDPFSHGTLSYNSKRWDPVLVEIFDEARALLKAELDRVLEGGESAYVARG